MSDLKERDSELAEKQEELQAQKEELTAAIEELVRKNSYLTETLEQLQKRNKELDQLLYRTSHDLKTPIASLQGLLYLLETEDLTDAQRQLTEYMDQKVSQMSDILKSLNMLSQASFEKIQVTKVNLKEICGLVMRDLKYLPHFQQTKLHFESNGLDSIRIDEHVLYNILKCLISNAIIFRDSVQEGNVWITFDQKNDGVILEITDDGDGISSEIGPNIFNMFFRGSERSMGSGLGLYIVKEITDRLRGEVRWISKPGKTTFQVFLPGSK